MPKLQARGSHSEYVNLTRMPTEVATSSSKVIMSAFVHAVEALLEIVNLETKSDLVERSVLGQYMALKDLYADMRSDLDRVELVLNIIEARLMNLEDG